MASDVVPPPDLHWADIAKSRLARVQPAWCGIRRVDEVVRAPGRTVFHAGPPFATVRDIPAPVRNSICVAAVYEGWASDFARASLMLDQGSIDVAAAQDHTLVVPLAGVLSPTMAVMEVRDATGGDAAVHVALNEGQQHALRLGQLDAALPDHLRWLNGPFASWLRQCVHQPVVLPSLIARSLTEGDDGHARTMAGSRMFGEVLLNASPAGAATDAARTFLAASSSFALNPWMAAAALWLRAAEGLPGCPWVTRVGGNGSNFGIQLAGRPGQWVTLNAPLPEGIKESGLADVRPAGTLGDSTVVDFLGLGGQALAHAPALRDALGPVLPEDALERPSKVLGAPGVVDGLAHSVTDASKCAQGDTGPLVLIGMIDAAGMAGRIGGGVVDVPGGLFEAALAHLHG